MRAADGDLKNIRHVPDHAFFSRSLDSQTPHTLFKLPDIILTGLQLRATRFKDRSVVLLALFLLFTAYMGLTKIGAIPKMYSDEFPQAYFELVNKAESGQEKAVEGKYRHEAFKEMYDRFIGRQGEGKK